MPTQREQLKYSVKIMNPTKKSEYSMEKFTLLQSGRPQRDAAHVVLGKTTAINRFSRFYIIPGHGLRGKQEWLCEDSICTCSTKERKIFFFGVFLEILRMLNHEKEEKHPLPRQAKLHVCPLMILKEISPRKSEKSLKGAAR